MIKQTENKRYKQLDYQGEKILLDMDSNKLLWLFPFLIWFLPVKGYLCVEIPIFKEPKPETNSKGWLILVSSVLSNILIRMTDKGFGDLTLFRHSQLIARIILFSSLFAVFCIRYIYRYRKNKIEIINEKTIFIRFIFQKHFFGKVKYVWKVLLVVIICYIAVVFFCITFLTSYLNIILIPVICMLEYLILISNTTILPPENDVEIIVLK